MTFALLIAALFLLIVIVVVAMEIQSKHVLLWLRSYLRNDWKGELPKGKTKHLMFCFVDHFEPGYGRPSYEVECARVARWRTEYPALCAGLSDADGRGPIHTFFYPEEEYKREHLDPLVEICRMGLGEIDIHLHHENDTDAGLREKLRRFTRILIDDHDALPRDPVSGQPRWGFIHGNWALDNSDPEGLACGVNNELIVLREEGCYADFTYPAAPSACQTSTINKIYYATDDPHRPKSHDHGERVRVGGSSVGDLMIIQGPLGFMGHSRKFGLIPRIENADVRTSSPPVPERVDAWVDTGIHVDGRPEWVFVKVHTHGVEERDINTLLGAPMRRAFEYLEKRYNDGTEWKLHYVSAREMYNIVKAAEAGHDDDAGQYRDFVIPRPKYEPRPARS